MALFRFASSIYGGSDVVIGASWDLLPWFVAAGAAVIIVHAVVKAVARSPVSGVGCGYFVRTTQVAGSNPAARMARA